VLGDKFMDIYIENKILLDMNTPNLILLRGLFLRLEIVLVKKFQNWDSG
jgi:hypothetical protein